MKQFIINFLCQFIFLATSIYAKQSLKLWEEERHEIQKILDQVVKKFEQKHKEISVKRSHFKTEDLRNQYLTAGLAGSGAELLLVPNDFAGVFSTAGIILPLQSYFDFNRFDSSTIIAIKDEKNNIWGVPINKGNHLLLFINGNLISSPPKTAEQMIEAGKKIVSQSSGKRFGLTSNFLEPFWFVPFYGAFGEQPLVNRKPNLDNNAMINALTLVSDLKFKHKIIPPDCDYSCADSLFVDGKAAMTINGDWSIKKYRSAFKEKLIIAPLPLLKETGKPMAPMISGKYLLFNKKLSGSSLEAAIKFTKFVISDEIQEFLAITTKRLPSVIEIMKKPKIKNDQDLQASLAATVHTQPMPMEVEMRAVWDAIRPQLQEVMSGRTDPKTAAQIMQKDAENRIKEMKQ